MPTAVLLSGGLDSAVLVADEAAHDVVQPIYVRAGLAWEDREREIVARMLASPPFERNVRPLVTLNVDMRDVYSATHWAVQGTPPEYHTPDEDVYLPGRNIVLLGKAGIFCATAKIGRLVMGTLAHNPFPDATPEFRDAIGRAMTLGLAHELTIDAPYAGKTKAEVIRRGAALGVPFEMTLSCMNPPQAAGDDGRGAGRRQPAAVHCGECSKCRERHDAFLEAGVPDSTTYVTTINLA